MLDTINISPIAKATVNFIKRNYSSECNSILEQTIYLLYAELDSGHICLDLQKFENTKVLFSDDSEFQIPKIEIWKEIITIFQCRLKIIHKVTETIEI